MSSTYPEDGWVRANGLNLHYLDWGGDRSKKPLILMHGIGGHAHQFDEFAPHMTDRWRVVALDARGCGDSDWSREGYPVQAFATDIAAFAQILGLFPYDYYGHSQGSRIGMALGAYYGEFIDHLVLGDYGPLPDPSPRGKETAARRLAGSERVRPKGFFNRQMAFDWHREGDPGQSEENIWKIIRNTYRTNWDGILVPKTDPEINWLSGRTALKEGPFLWECVGRISCKTLVLRGENSAVLDQAQAETMVETIPGGNGALGQVPNTGHGLHDENMEGTLAIIREFLDS